MFLHSVDRFPPGQGRIYPGVKKGVSKLETPTAEWEVPGTWVAALPAGYWLPNPLWSPQSGHCHVMPLQDIPQTFSSMHTWHMANPQRQRQLKKASLPQQWQAALRAIRRRALDDEVFAEEVFMIDLDAAVHDNIDSRVGEHPGGFGIL
jgi:hypothetical protein